MYHLCVVRVVALLGLLVFMAYFCRFNLLIPKNTFDALFFFFVLFFVRVKETIYYIILYVDRSGNSITETHAGLRFSRRLSQHITVVRTDNKRVLCFVLC